jgi:hypothetical protein
MATSLKNTGCEDRPERYRARSWLRSGGLPARPAVSQPGMPFLGFDVQSKMSDCARSHDPRKNMPCERSA